MGLLFPEYGKAKGSLPSLGSRSSNTSHPCSLWVLNPPQVAAPKAKSRGILAASMPTLPARSWFAQAFLHLELSFSSLS